MKKLFFGLLATIIVTIAGSAIFYACKKDANERELANNVETLIKSVKNTSEQMRFRINEEKTVVMTVSYPDAEIGDNTLIVDYAIESAMEEDDYAVVLLGYFNRDDFALDTVIPELNDTVKILSVNPFDFVQVRAYTSGRDIEAALAVFGVCAMCAPMVCQRCGPSTYYTGKGYFNAYVQCDADCKPCYGGNIGVHYKEYTSDQWKSENYEQQSVFIIKADNFIMNGQVSRFEEIFR
jgi:hypothetical protein